MILINDSVVYMGSSAQRPLTKLPKGNWLVKFDPERLCFYLERTKDFVLPDKIYGDTKKLSKRYLNTFKQRSTNLGVLLSGLKGTGKSLTARYTAIESELPVIIVSEPFGGVEFNQFLTQIGQECVIFFDEFEKVYSENEKQHLLLSVLDGVYPNKFLFLLTVNNQYAMNTYFMNRPGRIHYSKQYNGLPEDVIVDVCKDILNNKKKTGDIIRACNYLGEVSMDIVTSLIGECNMYPKESIQEIVSIMNLRPEDCTYLVDVFVDGVNIANGINFHENPYTFNDDSEFTLSWYGDTKLNRMTKEGWNNLYFNEACKDVRIKSSKNDFQMIYECTPSHISVPIKNNKDANAEVPREAELVYDSIQDEAETSLFNDVYNIRLVFRKKEIKNSVLF